MKPSEKSMFPISRVTGEEESRRPKGGGRGKELKLKTLKQENDSVGNEEKNTLCKQIKLCNVFYNFSGPYILK